MGNYSGQNLGYKLKKVSPGINLKYLPVMVIWFE